MGAPELLRKELGKQRGASPFYEKQHDKMAKVAISYCLDEKNKRMDEILKGIELPESTEPTISISQEEIKIAMWGGMLSLLPNGKWHFEK